MKNQSRLIRLLFILAGVTALVGFSLSALKVYRYHFAPPAFHPLFRADLSDVFDESLSHYYVHTDGKKVEAVKSGLYAHPPFDDMGIPLVDYHGETGQQYNPVTIAQFGLDNYELYLQTQDRQFLDTFFKQADWLLNDQKNGKWFYQFDNTHLNLKKPWISAMSQGQGISVLLRAFQLSNDNKYRDASLAAFSVFKMAVNQEGISVFLDYGTWYEEYPDPQSPGHVLNGHIWALFGLWDLYRVTGDREVSEYFDKGISALITDLEKYDTGYWVLNDQKSSFFLVDQLYMDFQIDQLKALFTLTRNPVFEEYANRWEGYRQNKTNFLRILWPSLWRKVRLKIK